MSKWLVEGSCVYALRPDGTNEFSAMFSAYGRPKDMTLLARRAVACVNACAAIPDPAALRDVVETAKLVLPRLRARVDPAGNDPLWPLFVKLEAALADLEKEPT